MAADPPGHTFAESVSVELSTEGPSEIFYTLNGMSPFGQDAIAYSGPIVLDGNALLTFVAKDGSLWSKQQTELYEQRIDIVAPDMVARELRLDDDNVVFTVRRGEGGAAQYQSIHLRSVGLQEVLLHNVYISINPDSWSFYEEGIFKLETPVEPERYLAPGESIDLVVSYLPTETLRTAVLVIESNDQRAQDGFLMVGMTGRIWDW